MQNINSLITVLHSRDSQKAKINALYDFYINNTALSRAYLYWNKKQYKKTLSYLLSFLEGNKKELLLTYHPIKTNLRYSTLVGSTSLESNFATIKTIGQLLDLQKAKSSLVISQLIKNYKKNKTPILCFNDSIDDQKKCKAIIHEFHAWLLSGCMRQAQVQGLFGEWRIYIVSTSLLRKMDCIFS